MLIQIKIIFSFMDHIINMRKGYLWDCLFPCQYSRNLLQNLEGKFIKSSSKSKVLIHYPIGCPRRHCAPNTFIYFIISSYLLCVDLADPCRNPSWSSESFMNYYILCDLFHGIHGVQEMQVSIMMTHNAELVHRLLSGVVKLGLQGNHGSGEGDVAKPQQIHWPGNDSLRNSHTVRVKCAGALSCWNDTCYIIPLLLGFSIT